MIRSNFSVTARASTARRVLRLATGAVTLAVLAACSTAPLSFINDRQVYFKAELNRYPVYVVSVDNGSPGFHPLPITTGEHRLVLDAPPVAGFSIPVQKVYTMNIEPCTRYYIAAQRTSPLLQDWNLVVEKTWAVAGCDPVAERAKADKEIAAGRQPASLTSEIDTPAAPTTIVARTTPH